MLQEPYCQYTQRLLDKLTELNDKAKDKIDLEQIKKAIWYAITYHGEQKRDSGEPFYSHPLEVAYMVSDYLFKTDVLVASILHDIVEDTEVTTEMILDHFGGRVAEMVNRLTRNQSSEKKLSIEQILINSYIHQDKEVLLIKLIDRLHNLSTLNVLSATRKKKILEETASNFFVLAIYSEHKTIEKGIYEIYSKYQEQQPSKVEIFSFFNDNFFSLPYLQNDLNHI